MVLPTSLTYKHESAVDFFLSVQDNVKNIVFSKNNKLSIYLHCANEITIVHASVFVESNTDEFPLYCVLSHTLKQNIKLVSGS